MVYRVYVEKKPELAREAAALAAELRELLEMKGLTRVRIVNRYDVERIGQALFDQCVKTVFSEPQTDMVSYDLGDLSGCAVFAVETLPGQFDQRADSAAQCVQIISQGPRPAVRAAKVYLLYGALTPEELDAARRYLINPVECREAELALPDTLEEVCAPPREVATVTGFCALEEAGLAALIADLGLAMEPDDLAVCRAYFSSEGRDPTITELRMIEAYWSDHCRHTTFLTGIDQVSLEDGLHRSAYEKYLETRRLLAREGPVTFMDLATAAGAYLKKTGGLPHLVDSEERNACTVRITANVDGQAQNWLLLFKNETHNHPTEIEPFGGAATCIGGAIRDPLSGRAYVYAAMRLTGAADPRRPLGETLPGKLPQRKIVTGAAAGYSSYGNQIGIATGQVDELYHPGYAAKRMEIGAVIAAAPEENVRAARPAPGDRILLLGGRTGRDGCGGAAGSSKSHTEQSLSVCGAEVQKGNAPEERKLQRLFRNPAAARLIKRCNDFGAGGVSVAVGELADGVEIDLDAIPRKYEGLDGTELAVSESQERMAVVIAPEDTDRFLSLAGEENLEAAVIAEVTDSPRLVMRWRGRRIVDISRAFLSSCGAEKHADAALPRPEGFAKTPDGDFRAAYLSLASDLNVCSKRGLAERFDSTIGAGTILAPFGGRRQLTPIQAMAHKLSTKTGTTDTCSLMAWGFNPFISERSPYHGAYLAVVESLSRLVATGAGLENAYLTLQEYFGRPGKDPRRWGTPMAALLGAFMAQMELGVAAIGGKDSMSGTFESLDVPPTLVSFAVAADTAGHVVSPEFKRAGHRVVLLRPKETAHHLPEPGSLKEVFSTVTRLMRAGKVCAAWTPGYGGVAEAVMKMGFGNHIGFCFDDTRSLEELFAYAYGSFVLELTDSSLSLGLPLGVTTERPVLQHRGETLSLSELLPVYEGVLERVFPCNIEHARREIPTFSSPARPRIKPLTSVPRPRALIPVFPGTNCEYDTARAMEAAGIEPELLVIGNLTPDAVAASVQHFANRAKNAQILFLPGGFSGGDEPDGSGKFITAFFRSGPVRDETHALLKRRGGLMCGICNGFQALIKLGLLPYGEIRDAKETDPTLTYNTIGRHQSRLVRVRIASAASPWLAETKVGEIYTVPISHGEGRFLAEESLIFRLAQTGQIATQYVDAEGIPTSDVRFNPGDSAFAVEGITSPDGKVLGKMGHSERVGPGLYKNVEGLYGIGLFESAAKYFR